MTPHRATLLGIAPTLLIIGVLMVVPMIIMAAYSLMEASSFGGVLPHFSAEAYIKLLFDRDLDDSLAFDPSYMIILWRSLRIAALATLITLCVGFPVAYFIATRPPEQRTLLIFLITIPFWTNLLIRTYSWVLILRDTGLINTVLQAGGLTDQPVKLLYTEGAILFGLVYTYAPFMVLPLYTSLEKLDFRLVEAARDLYCGPWGALRHVVLPLVKPGLVAGSILVFVPCLGAFVAPDLLGGGKELMISTLIQLQFTSSRNWPFGAALALVLLALVMLTLTVSAVRQARATAEGGH